MSRKPLPLRLLCDRRRRLATSIRLTEDRAIVSMRQGELS
jgi:hypothetical protein